MNRNWKLFICTILIFTIIAGCASKVEEPPTINTPATNTKEVQEETLPTPTPLPLEENIPEAISAKIPLIFSHGGAPCDFGALVFFTKHPDVDLIGMVLSRGEIHPENAVDHWAVFLFDVLNYKEIPIAVGTDERMDSNSHDFPAAWRAAGDNFWGLALPEQVNEIDPAVGHELIIELVNNSAEKVSIIAMASMIDLALAFQEDPGIIDNIANVVIMGGAFTVPGNLDDAPYEMTNEVAEWNIWIDAEAANYVFNSGVPLSIVPLDAIQYLVQPEDVNRIRSIDDPGVGYVTQNWNRDINNNPGGFLIWDTITAAAVTNPENFFWTYDGVDVLTESGDFQGQTIALNNGATHTRYATGADYDAILDLLFKVYRGDPVSALPDYPGTSDAGNDAPTGSNPETIITELAGSWEGFTGNFLISFFFESECELNELCGTFEISEFSLTGDVTIVKVDGSRYEFKTTNLSSGQTNNNYEYLEIQEDGTLLYFTTGEGVTSEAVLNRK